MKFKVGDEILCVIDGMMKAWITKGKVYTVLKVISSDYVRIPDDHGTPREVFYERFISNTEEAKALYMQELMEKMQI